MSVERLAAGSPPVALPLPRGLLVFDAAGHAYELAQERAQLRQRGEPGDARRGAGDLQQLRRFLGQLQGRDRSRSFSARRAPSTPTRWAPWPPIFVRTFELCGRSTRGHVRGGFRRRPRQHALDVAAGSSAREPHAGQPPSCRLLAAHRRKAHQRDDRRGAHRVAPRAERHRLHAVGLRRRPFSAAQPAAVRRSRRRPTTRRARRSRASSATTARTRFTRGWCSITGW